MKTSPSTHSNQKTTAQSRVGVAYGLGAFLWWACAVFYFKAVQHVPAAEVLAHRILWSAPLLVGLLALQGKMAAVRQALKNRRSCLLLLVSTVLIAGNWYIFIWAVAHDQVLQASMGYFINPLVNVLLGFLFLRERFRMGQLLGIVFAAVAVLVLVVNRGELPLISLGLAFSFGLYGLVRKQVQVGSVTGLAVETLLLMPLALAYLLFCVRQEQLVFLFQDRLTDGLLLSAGVITALPLIWYVHAAKRLRYASIGLMQYITPSMTFFMAVFLFREPFDRIQLTSFILIWIAVAIYTFDMIRPIRSKEGFSGRSEA